jgi:hypothetical protein
MPFLIYSAFARSASFGTILSPMSPTSTATLIAMQRGVFEQRPGAEGERDIVEAQDWRHVPVSIRQ